MKILGIYFSYNVNLMNQNNYCQAITNIHGILKVWKMDSLSIKGKTLVFKTVAISKLVYIAVPTVIPNHIADQVAKMQKCFILNDSSPKIKHETLRRKFKVGVLNNGEFLYIYLVNILSLPSNSILTIILKVNY